MADRVLLSQDLLSQHLLPSIGLERFGLASTVCWAWNVAVQALRMQWMTLDEGSHMRVQAPVGRPCFVTAAAGCLFISGSESSSVLIACPQKEPDGELRDGGAWDTIGLDMPCCARPARPTGLETLALPDGSTLMFISDRANHLVHRLRVWLPTDDRPLMVEHLGSSDGGRKHYPFRFPLGLAIVPSPRPSAAALGSGVLYVVDSDRHRVVVSPAHSRGQRARAPCILCISMLYISCALCRTPCARTCTRARW